MEKTATEMMMLSRPYDPLEVKRRRIADAVAAKIIAETRDDIDELPDAEAPLHLAHRIIQDAVLQAAYEATVEYAKVVELDLGTLRANNERVLEAARLAFPQSILATTQG